MAISQVSSRKALLPALPGGARAKPAGDPVLPETAAEFISLISSLESGAAHGPKILRPPLDLAQTQFNT